MARDPDCRVIVIGGGVIGLTAAVALLEAAPDVSVRVLERAEVGDGASRYAGALDIPYFWSPLHRRLVEVSWAWHDAHPAEAAAYRRPVPMAWFAEPDDDLPSRVATPLSIGMPGAPSDWRGPDGTRRLDGPSFVIDSAGWCRALARDLAWSGRGEVVEHEAVIALEEGPATTTVFCADGTAHEAAHVVMALGAWLPSWNERARAWAAARGLRTKRVFGFDIEITPPVSRPLAVGWPSADIYFHPAPASHGYRLSLRHDEWDAHPDEPAAMPRIALERAGWFLDDLVGAGRWSITGHRIFVDNYTPELAPVVTRCADLGARVTVATGTHGSGVRLAPGIGDLVARTVIAELRASGAETTRPGEPLSSAARTS
jgi:glycine/D-amino acid oxidase-like deaminating enzyme